jgi:hypothetical protein
MRFSALAVVLASAPARAEAPDLEVGPELIGKAARVEAPIAHVTIYSDRARVRRRAEVSVSGIEAIRLPDLPGAVLLDTVRVSAPGARILRVEVLPVQHELVSIAEVKALLDALDAANDDARRIQLRLEVERKDLELIGRIRPAARVEEKDRDGRPPPPITADPWIASIRFMSDRELEARRRIHALELELEKIREKQAAVTNEIGRQNLGGLTDQRLEAIVVLEGHGTTALELEYFIAGARWKPAYDLRFDGGRLTVATTALLQQATGEDWSDVALALSTAIPGQGIDLPELLTWTLGESRDFTPAARAARAPPAAARYAPPEPRVTKADEERALELALVLDRLDALAPSSVETRASGGRVAFDQDATKVTGEVMLKRSVPAAARPPAPPAEEALMEVTVAADRAPGSYRRGPSYTTKSLALFEPPPTEMTFADPFLPAVSGGGLDFVYDAPTRASIPSGPEDRRIPLASETFAAEIFHEATPSLDTTAYVRAKVRNTGDRPLLRGPTNIFVGGELVAQGEIETTGPGGEIAFALGADENIRLVRTVTPKTEREGFISKDDVTTYVTKIQIGNYGKRPVSIEVIDQIPKSSHEDVEVELVSATPRPKADPDADGVLRWRVDVPAQKTSSIELAYRIKRPADWQLQQQ